MQGRGDRLLQPVQALQHTGIVGPKAQHFAKSFIERAIGVVAVLTIFHHHERHTGGDDARHRPDSAQAMAGLHAYLARRDEGLGALEVSSPAFVLHSAKHGALHRTTHGFPRYRWASVEDSIGAELG